MVIGLTFLSAFAQKIVEIFLSVVVRWWLNLLKGAILKAVVSSDFKVRIVGGVDPLRLALKFKLHNGSPSTVTLNRLAINLYCSGEAHVSSVVGVILDNPFVSADKFRLKTGESTNVVINVIPDFRLLFSLIYGRFSLRYSSLHLSTAWGSIKVPLAPESIQNELTDSASKRQIEEYLKSVRVKLKEPL